jgi:hypothetical protein
MLFIDLANENKTMSALKYKSNQLINNSLKNQSIIKKQKKWD